ncbi:hypothetical protein Tlie_1586 [Thermovirga lienii DSM 17291]|jgi:hypothetical protein|uniref:Uncharacterized protein n=1 Tax=Thermovirga lienii (strain ATCC BAA-1197 / DSM 17291 / Cas60314) TaxID=580340 RepID=G7V7Q4_THELD|nr:hypothetical protein [Thermovirga lienii]MDN5319099.1 hypothetical protein [Thermovirga sp.]AER67308.1 hypothetical protein Tlie_1586 [Thermovirga lienii DSM 17291]KUK43157.1 MAG: Uncharacterized protein XD70_0019 [Thermovirga lienii]MDN5367802.1 hypothetical protein [Thermovirga sp.]HCD71595.1 hypothetical protein [Thermovirga lienii]
MYFFKFIALVLGVIMITLAPIIWTLKERFRTFLLTHILPEEQPFWLWVSGAISVLIVAITWYMEATTKVPFSWIITILVTLALPKSYFMLFQYEKTRKRILPLIKNDVLFFWGYSIFIYVLGVIILSLGMFSL